MIGQEGTEIGDKNKKSVLLVEDDFYIRSLYAMELEYAGFRVLEADDAAQARRLLSDEPVSLIVLDIMLPGERGVDFLSWLKGQNEYKDISVMILTNVGEEETTKKCLELGAKAYLLKSHVSPKEVAGKVLEINKVETPLIPSTDLHR